MPYSKTQWNSEVQTLGGDFLQSFEWGEFQASLGADVWRLEDEDKGLALVIKRELPLGLNWLYSPRPILTENLIQEIEDLARQERSVFVKIDGVQKQVGWSESESVQPQHSLILNLEKSEDDLLNEMHKKTRYNLRLAQRKGVRVRFSKAPTDLENFLKLTREVNERSGFSYHPDNYYRKMLEVLRGDCTMELAIAEFEQAVLAVHILISFGERVTYAHGASSWQQKNLMAPVLLQWESIRRARKAGMLEYDFYGIAPEGVEDHPWAGISRFKLGFGGDRVDYLPAREKVLRRGAYALYKVGRLWR